MGGNDELLAATVSDIVARARTRWPDIALEPEILGAELATRVGSEADPAAALAALHGEDLYLACACARGVPAALAVFERQLMVLVPDFVARIDGVRPFVDEIQQQLRERLLVGAPTQSARIARYTGRGALGGWLRVAAVRTAIDMLRARGGPLPYDDAAALAET